MEYDWIGHFLELLPFAVILYAIYDTRPRRGP